MIKKIYPQLKKFVTEHENIAQLFLLHHNEKLDVGCRFIQEDYKKIEEYDCTVEDFAKLLTFIINDSVFDELEGEGSIVVEFGNCR